ncbi:unnamed protein product [Sympodiomycopsis kandeliae]
MPDSTLEATSPLGTLLSYAPTSTSGVAIDFSGLDPNTFNLLNEACSQHLQNRSQDAELRLALTAKNKELESTMSRLRSEKDDMRAALDLAQRNAEAAKALSLQTQTQYEEADSNRRQLVQDLAQSRRECQSMKAIMRQSKQMGERSIARQRERFTDAAIQSAARNQEQQCIILPNIFTYPQGQHQSSSSQIEKQQISELESQRLALLSSNTALRRLCTDAINSFAENVSNVADDFAYKQRLQDDLFPQGEPLRKDYILSTKQGSHPAVVALAAVQLAGQKAVRNKLSPSTMASNGQRSTNRTASTSVDVTTKKAAAAESNIGKPPVSQLTQSLRSGSDHSSSVSLPSSEGSRSIPAVSLDGKASTSSSSSSSSSSGQPEHLQRKARRIEAPPEGTSKRPRIESTKPSTSTEPPRRALTSRLAPNQAQQTTRVVSGTRTKPNTSVALPAKSSTGALPIKSSAGTLSEALQNRRNQSS